MSDRKETANANIGSFFTILLTIAFIVLKLCHVIEWSWIWVLSPLWIPIAIVIAIWAIFLLLTFLGAFFNR